MSKYLWDNLYINLYKNIIRYIIAIMQGGIMVIENKEIVNNNSAVS